MLEQFVQKLVMRSESFVAASVVDNIVIVKCIIVLVEWFFVSLFHSHFDSSSFDSHSKEDSRSKDQRTNLCSIHSQFSMTFYNAQDSFHDHYSMNETTVLFQSWSWEEKHYDDMVITWIFSTKLNQCKSVVSFVSKWLLSKLLLFSLTSSLLWNDDDDNHVRSSVLWQQ